MRAYKLLLKFVAGFFHKFYRSTITKVVEVDYTGHVYNLSIEDNETYIADGFVVHNCRSQRVPILKDEFAINPKSDSVVGGRTFDDWLRGQDAGFQDEYFSQFPDGKDKAALFRRGGLDIQQFRNETGVEYSLDQLRGLEPLAFKKANIT